MGEVLQIDRIRCDGHGLCAELLPELIVLDDWGYPIIKTGAVLPSLVDHARRAVDACPVLALRLARSRLDDRAPPAPAKSRRWER
ncbi:MAG: ferredoxin [Candidatus Dormibacteraeota bacterium]|nr:ferredoxin [Candidatus Dormibacteraeota bacterium]